MGWPAATALAGLWVAREGRVPRGTLAQLLDGLLGGVAGDDRARSPALPTCRCSPSTWRKRWPAPARWPLLDAGLPVRAGRPGWLELPDPVRDALARGALDPLAARAAAAHTPTRASCRRRSRCSPATAAVAELLAGRRWQELAALDLAELRVILSTLPEAALAAHPFGLVQVARLAERTVDFELRWHCSNGRSRCTRTGRRGVRSKRSCRHPRRDRAGDETEAEARAVLAAAAPGESVARARALTALARVDAWRGESAAMLRAEGALAQAAALCRIAREPQWEAWTLTSLGYRVAFARGDLELAVEQMSAALALLPEPDSERAAVATFLAEALAYLGPAGRCRERAARGGGDRAPARRSPRAGVRGVDGTTLASLRLDGAATIQRIRAVERHPGDWFEHPTGAEFLADAALALARVGERELALEYAGRARARAEALGHPEIAWIATGAVEARCGDPVLALTVLARLRASPQQAPRDEWRTLLLQAYAAQRAGDGRRGVVGRAGPRRGGGARAPGSADAPRTGPRRRAGRRRAPAGAARDAARRVRA